MKVFRCLTYCFLLLLTAIPVHAGEDSRVTLQLAWKHQFQFAGYYAALARGFYRDVGLDVTISEGGEGRFAREEVHSGRAQYGVAGVELLLHRAEGNDFVALAAIFQHSPSILLTRGDSGITTAQDLMGKRVMILPGKKDADILAVFQNENIGPDQFTRMDQTYNLGDLVEGKTQAVSAYLTNEPWYLEQKGITPGIILPRTYGVDFYSDCLFTTGTEIKKHPERVKKFREASLKGWTHAMANSEEIIDLILEKYSRKKNREHLRYEASVMQKLIFPKLVQMGHMNPGRWRHIGDTFVQLGELSSDYTLTGFLYDPNPAPDYTWIKRITATSAGVFILAGILMLAAFNRRLNRVVLERTRNLEKAEEALGNSERLYRTLFDNVPVGIVLGDPSGELVAVNNKAAIITGSPKAELLGRNLEDIYHNFIDGESFTRQVGPNTDGRGVEFKLRKKDGTQFDGRFTSAVVSIDNSRHLLSMIEDITPEKQMEREKMEIAAKLQRIRKMEAIGLMAGGVAHDLNNILSGIINYPELIILQLPRESELKKPLLAVQESGKRAAAVVADLLTVARGVAGTRQAAGLNDMIKEYLASPENGKLRLQHPGVECILRPSPDLLNISCSPIHIKKCIMNLVMNAFEAIEGTGEVVITTRNQYIEKASFTGHEIDRGEYAVLTVADSGTGLSREDRERIFEPFYTKKVMGKSGTGLGLAVVWNTVRDHNGGITVDSDEGGTRFELYFPITREELAPSAKPVELSDLSGKGEAILVVDDEPQQRDIAARMLSLLGYRVFSVASGEEAIEYLKEKPCDLVLLDMLMEPGINGRQTYEAILARNPGQKALIASGFAADKEVKKARRLGSGPFIKKPYSMEILGRTVLEELKKEV